MAREGSPAYLDVQATSPVDPRVLDAMLPYLVGQFGNAHSKTHAFGWDSEKAVENAREQVPPAARRTLAASSAGSRRRRGPMSTLSPPPSWKQVDRSNPSRQSQVAALIGADAREVVFTSGATESNNMSVKGIARFYGAKKKHIVTTQTEHKCVLDSCRAMEREGFEVTSVSPRGASFDASRRRRGCHVWIFRGDRVAATPRLPRG